jgi:putative tricarboxylic transport membrane protein
MESDSETGARGTPTWVVDAAVALIMAGVGAVVAINSLLIGAGWGDDGPRSGYFPFYLGLFIFASSLVNFFLAVRNKVQSIFVLHSQLRLVLAVLLPSIAYVFAIRYLGIYVASALFIAAFMRWQGKFGMAKLLVVGLGVSVSLFVMFEIWFKVALPKGPLEAMLGF